MLALVFVIPLMMSYIIKIYAIRAILGGNGFLNRILLYLGIIDQPLTFLIFNLQAVLLTLSVILLPFAILPIFIALERIPRNILDASADLGASSWQTFRSVIWPLSLQGTIVGATFTFVLALGDFVTPQMVGGTSGFTFGRIIYSQFGFAFNWPFGAALSVILLARRAGDDRCGRPVHAGEAPAVIRLSGIGLVLPRRDRRFRASGPLRTALRRRVLLVLQVREQRGAVGQLLLRRLLVARSMTRASSRRCATRSSSAPSPSLSR